MDFAPTTVLVSVCGAVALESASRVDERRVPPRALPSPQMPRSHPAVAVSPDESAQPLHQHRHPRMRGEARARAQVCQRPVEADLSPRHAGACRKLNLSWPGGAPLRDTAARRAPVSPRLRGEVEQPNGVRPVTARPMRPSPMYGASESSLGLQERKSVNRKSLAPPTIGVDWSFNSVSGRRKSM